MASECEKCVFRVDEFCRKDPAVFVGVFKDQFRWAYPPANHRCGYYREYVAPENVGFNPNPSHPKTFKERMQWLDKVLPTNWF